MRKLFGYVPELSIRVLKQLKGSRHIEPKLIPVKDKLEAYALGEALAVDRQALVDLIDENGLILKRFSLWAL